MVTRSLRILLNNTVHSFELEVEREVEFSLKPDFETARGCSHKVLTVTLLCQVGMRVTLVCVALLVAVAVPNLELVISLVGAVLFSTIGLLIPAAAHLFTLLGEGRHGWVYTLTLIKDGVLIALSLLVAVVGVYSSLATTAVTPAVTEKATH